MTAARHRLTIDGRQLLAGADGAGLAWSLHPQLDDRGDGADLADGGALLLTGSASGTLDTDGVATVDVQATPAGMHLVLVVGRRWWWRIAMPDHDADAAELVAAPPDTPTPTPTRGPPGPRGAWLAAVWADTAAGAAAPAAPTGGTVEPEAGRVAADPPGWTSTPGPLGDGMERWVSLAPVRPGDDPDPDTDPAWLPPVVAGGADAGAGSPGRDGVSIWVAAGSPTDPRWLAAAGRAAQPGDSWLRTDGGGLYRRGPSGWVRVGTVESAADLSGLATVVALDAETTARSAADAALSGRVDDAAAAGTALSGRVDAAAAAGTALSGRVDAVEHRIVDVELAAAEPPWAAAAADVAQIAGDPAVDGSDEFRLRSVAEAQMLAWAQSAEAPPAADRPAGTVMLIRISRDVDDREIGVVSSGPGTRTPASSWTGIGADDDWTYWQWHRHPHGWVSTTLTVQQAASTTHIGSSVWRGEITEAAVLAAAPRLAGDAAAAARRTADLRPGPDPTGWADIVSDTAGALAVADAAPADVAAAAALDWALQPGSPDGRLLAARLLPGSDPARHRVRLGWPDGRTADLQVADAHRIGSDDDWTYYAWSQVQAAASAVLQSTADDSHIGRSLYVGRLDRGQVWDVVSTLVLGGDRDDAAQTVTIPDRAPAAAAAVVALRDQVRDVVAVPDLAAAVRVDDTDRAALAIGTSTAGSLDARSWTSELVPPWAAGANRLLLRIPAGWSADDIDVRVARSDGTSRTLTGWTAVGAVATGGRPGWQHLSVLYQPGTVGAVADTKIECWTKLRPSHWIGAAPAGSGGAPAPIPDIVLTPTAPASRAAAGIAVNGGGGVGVALTAVSASPRVTATDVANDRFTLAAGRYRLVAQLDLSSSYSAPSSRTLLAHNVVSIVGVSLTGATAADTARISGPFAAAVIAGATGHLERPFELSAAAQLALTLTCDLPPESYSFRALATLSAARIEVVA